VVLRLLSLHPEQRGTISELVEALERAPVQVTAECTRPSFRQEFLVEAHAGRLQPRASARHWLSVAAVGVLLVIWAQWSTPRSRSEEPTLVQGLTSEEGSSDTETAGLGETAASTPVEQAPAQSTREGLTADTLPELVPGQTRPDGKGRCPRKGLISLNKGCWATTAVDPEGCAEMEGQMYKGTCYVPFIPRGRRPNSSHMDKR
jgi:hypothetical protein